MDQTRPIKKSASAPGPSVAKASRATPMATKKSTSAPGSSVVKSSRATPMATKKLTKRCFKLLKVALKLGKDNVLVGAKDVRKGIRRGVRGIVLLAGDIKPIDVMCTLSEKCVEAGIPYIFVPDKADIKSVLGSKRSCLTVTIKFRPEYKELFEVLAQKLENLPK